MYLDGKIGGIWRNKRSNVFVLYLLTHLRGEEDVALIAGSAPRLTKSLIVFRRRDSTLLNVSRARFITDRGIFAVYIFKTV